MRAVGQHGFFPPGETLLLGCGIPDDIANLANSKFYSYLTTPAYFIFASLASLSWEHANRHSACLKIMNGLSLCLLYSILVEYIVFSFNKTSAITTRDSCVSSGPFGRWRPKVIEGDGDDAVHMLSDDRLMSAGSVDCNRSETLWS
jgi:hypothetical protein